MVDSLANDNIRFLESLISQFEKAGLPAEKIKPIQEALFVQYGDRSISAEQFSGALSGVEDLSPEEKKRAQQAFEVAVATVAIAQHNYTVHQEHLSAQANEWRAENTNYLDQIYSNQYVFEDSKDYFSMIDKAIEADQNNAHTSKDSFLSGSKIGIGGITHAGELQHKSEEIQTKTKQGMKIVEHTGEFYSCIDNVCKLVNDAKGNEIDVATQAIENNPELKALTPEQVIEIAKDPDSVAKIAEIKDLNNQANEILAKHGDRKLSEMSFGEIDNLPESDKAQLTSIQEQIVRKGVELGDKHPELYEAYGLSKDGSQQHNYALGQALSGQYNSEEAQNNIKEFEDLEKLGNIINEAGNSRHALINAISPELRQEMLNSKGDLSADAMKEYLGTDAFKSLAEALKRSPEEILAKFEADPGFRAATTVWLKDSVESYNEFVKDNPDAQKELPDKISFSTEQLVQIKSDLEANGLSSKFEQLYTSAAAFAMSPFNAAGVAAKNVMEVLNNRNLSTEVTNQEPPKAEPHDCGCPHEKEQPKEQPLTADVKAQADQALAKIQNGTVPAGPREPGAVAATQEVIAQQSASLHA